MENVEFNTPPVQNSSKPKLIYFLVVVLVLIFGGIGGYLLGTKNTENNIPNKNSFPIATLEPVVISSPANYPIATISGNVSDWKTYTNPKYGYQFNYPKDYLLTGNEGSQDISLSDKNKAGKLTINISAVKVITSAKDWWNSEIEKCKISACAPSPGKILKELNIGGLPAIEADYQTPSLMSGEQKTYVVIDSRNKFWIRFEFDGNNYSEVYKNFNQILSTFKFLPQGSAAASDETAGWKMYKDAVLGFEFKYPSKIELDIDDSSNENPIFKRVFKLINQEQTFGGLVYYNNPENLSLKEFENKISSEDRSGQHVKVYTPEDEKISIPSGESGFLNKNGVYEPFPCDFYIFPKNNKIFIWLRYQNIPGEYSREDFYNQVLSTFKFL